MRAARNALKVEVGKRTKKTSTDRVRKFRARKLAAMEEVPPNEDEQNPIINFHNTNLVCVIGGMGVRKIYPCFNRICSPESLKSLGF